MIAAHFESVLAGVANVLVVARIDKIGTLGSLDIDELDALVLLDFFPVDVSLVLGDVDAVELYGCGIDGRGSFGLGGGGCLGGVVSGLLGRLGLQGLVVFLLGTGCGLHCLFLFWCSGGLDVGFLPGNVAVVFIGSVGLFVVLLLVLLDPLAGGFVDVGVLWRSNSRQGQE